MGIGKARNARAPGAEGFDDGAIRAGRKVAETSRFSGFSNAIFGSVFGNVFVPEGGFLADETRHQGDAVGISGAEYDAHLIEISDGDQFGSGFVDINPNSKIPALMDHSTTPPTRVFESGSILLYLAEKFGALLPKDPAKRTECLSWLFWQMGSAPYLGGGFGHFYAYAPIKIEYPINRFAMEVKRELDVLDRHLATNRYMCGDEYTIADIAIWPWYGALVVNKIYDAGEFLDVQSYTHVIRWTKEIAERDAAKRGRMVNRTWGEPEDQLHERHDASDFDMKTQDKLAKSA